MRTIICVFFLVAATAFAEERPTKIGVPTILSGDWAGLGQNIAMTVETFKKHYLKHPMEFVFEDAKFSSADGLKAYQRLITVSHVDFIIGGTSSNGTMAGAPLVNSSKTVLVTPLTGGSNIDGAGEWIFRLGNSDVLNGTGQAELFLQRGVKKVALVSEETEYTQDISTHFRDRFKKEGGDIVYDVDFAPNTSDFRSIAVALKTKAPQAIFFTTQTGTSLAVFLKQLDAVGGFSGEIHTTFTAADNPDANALAKGKFKGLYYLAPAYNAKSEALKKFLELYKADHGREPLITFHAAGTMDILTLLQSYLDKEKRFNNDGFRTFLLGVKNYDGLMGVFSFDREGNANTGFTPAQIK